jgi:hypothetical protein
MPTEPVLVDGKIAAAAAAKANARGERLEDVIERMLREYLENDVIDPR